MFDYANPSDAIPEEGTRRYHERMAEQVAAQGEPFRGFFDTADLHAQCRRLGYVEIEDLDRAALVALYLPHLADSPKRGPGGHVVRMSTR